jgi:hypothetical protein
MSSNSNNNKTQREILPKLDDETYARVYAEFTSNPLFAALLQHVSETMETLDSVVEEPPKRTDMEGFFALREQSIGARYALRTLIRDFLLEDIKPITTQTDEY